MAAQQTDRLTKWTRYYRVIRPKNVKNEHFLKEKKVLNFCNNYSA